MALYRGISGAGWGTSGGNVVFDTWPTGVTSGDTVFWILVAQVQSGSTPPGIGTQPSGWTLLGNVTSDSQRLLLYTTVYTGQAATGTVAFTGGIIDFAWCSIAYSGVTTFGAVNTNSGLSGNGSITGLSVARGTGLLLTVFANKAAVTSTPPTGANERLEFSSAPAFSINEEGSSGAAGTQTNAFSTATTPWTALSVVLDTGGATIGATLSGVTFPQRNAGLGPHQSSAGNEYFFGRDSTNTGTVEPHKATDPMTSFAAQTAKLMSSGNTTAIEAMATIPDKTNADLIHVVAQIATGAVYYNSFNLSTDAWTLTTSEVAVAAASFAPTTNFTNVSLAPRSNGNVVILYCAGLTAMTSGFHMVRYRERTGTNTYSTATNVDNGGSINWGNPMAVLGASDRVHCFLKDNTNNDHFQRTLSAANALQTFPSAFETNDGTVLLHTGGVGTSFVSGASTIVALPYRRAAGAPILKLARLTSADAPSVSTEDVGDPAGISGSTDQQAIVLVADGQTLRCVYSDTNIDVAHYTYDGAWDAGSVDWFGLSAFRISANIYERPTGEKKLAVVVDDGPGTPRYAEIDLPAKGFPFETNPLFRRVLSLR